MGYQVAGGKQDVSVVNGIDEGSRKKKKKKNMYERPDELHPLLDHIYWAPLLAPKFDSF
jgi:hypothetical protein